MHEERLLKLAELLETKVEREQFDMGVFYSKHDCGYAACAVGSACLDPWFKRRGFKLNKCKLPGFKEFSDWAAVTEFFEVKKEEAWKLFMENEGNRTPKQVAKNIRKFVKQKNKQRVTAAFA